MAYFWPATREHKKRLMEETALTSVAPLAIRIKHAVDYRGQRAAETPLPETSTTITVSASGEMLMSKKSPPISRQGMLWPHDAGEVTLRNWERNQTVLDGGRDFHSCRYREAACSAATSLALSSTAAHSLARARSTSGLTPEILCDTDLLSR